MMKKFLSATMLATSLVVAGGAFVTPAFAEVVYNRGNSADPESLDPHKTSTVYEAHILRDLFEGLVMQDAKAELIPGAAESWTVSDDGMVYTFKLRQGAIWSDGSPVTADDFVYSFRRLEDPATAAEYASMLYVGEERRGGEHRQGKPEELGVKAVDAITLEVTLKAPTPYFLEMLTHQSTYPVNKASIDKLGADWIKPGNLVSNGAYTLAEFVPNDHIKLVKNPKFHDAANVKIDVVNYIPTEDRSTAMKRFEAGELDSNDDLPTEQLTDLKAKFGDQIRIGAVSRHLLLRDQDRQGAVGQRRAAQRHLHGDRPRLPGREGLEQLDVPRLFDGAARHRGLHDGGRGLCRQVADRPRGRGQEDPRRARLQARQAAEDGDPLQHVGEPQEHGGRHPGAAEAARHRGDAAQHRHQDPLRPSRAEGRLRRRPRRLDRRLQGSGNLPRHFAQGERATTIRTTTARNSRS